MSSYKFELVSDALTREQKGEVDGPCFAVMELRDKLKSAMRGLQFINRDKKSLWVYMPDQPYCLGWIGYGDYRVGGDGTEMYVVVSGNISNDKYADYNVQHRMKMSTNIDVALRNAKKFIRPMTPATIAGTRLRDATNAVSNVVEGAKRRMREQQEKVIDAQTSYYGRNVASKLMNELHHLLTINHEFVDPQFGTDLATYFELAAEHDELANRTVPMWFVRVYERWGTQHFDVLTIDKANEPYQATISDEVQRFDAESLPDAIMQKLSVLNILEKDDYVDGVGYAAGEGMFYVVR